MKLELKTKQELLNHMKASREFNTYGRTPGWKLAFQMYCEATGQKLDLGCGKCFETVKTWLIS